MKTFDKLNSEERKSLSKGVIQISGRAMNRTALGIVDAMFQLYPHASFDEMKEMLPDSINESAPKNYKSLFKPYTSKPYGVIQRFDIKEEAEKENINIGASHFTEENEMFTTSDGVKVLVSKSWESKDTENKSHDLQNLINHVEQYGVRVVDYDKNKAFQKGKYSIEIINPSLHKKLIEEEKKSNKWLWIILLLIILGLLASFLLFGKDNDKVSENTSETDIVAVSELETVEEGGLNKDSLKNIAEIEKIKRNIASNNINKAESYTFQNIQFKKGSSDISDNSSYIIDSLYNILSENSNIKLLVTGHASQEGSNWFNEKIAKERALNIKSILLKKGILEDRIKSEGKGSTAPLCNEETEECLIMNRRIELSLNI
jgi:outer membrane protein OmpA-like peptidoglycan-associated protein